MKVSILESFLFMVISSFIGIMANPEILTASDSVTIMDLDSTKIVETVVIQPVAKVTEVTEVRTAPKAGSLVEPASRTTNHVQAPVATVDTANNVRFSWGAQSLFRATSTKTNSGNNIARVGRLIWGHNYTDFGNITRLKIGDTFILTENGIATTYRVAANPITRKAGIVLDVKNGTTLSYAGDARYDSIQINALTDMGFGGHSLVLLTCYGANSRYIVVADAI
jgi:hypothetical protein